MRQTDTAAERILHSLSALLHKELRIVESQVTRLENEIDDLNAALEPLTSFVLPGGSAAAASLHMARTVCRRAEPSTCVTAGTRAFAGSSTGTTSSMNRAG